MNKGSREYKTPTPVKLYIQLGRSTKVVVGNVKVPPAFNLYIQLGRSTKAFGTIKVPPPLNFTFSWEDQTKVFGCIWYDDDDMERTRAGPYAARSDLEHQVNHDAKIPSFAFPIQNGWP